MIETERMVIDPHNVWVWVALNPMHFDMSKNLGRTIDRWSMRSAQGFFASL
jgi:hypothetical protein